MAFDHCLKGCDDEEEFETSWTNMLLKYELADSVWFERLYAIRHKWCTALSKDFFSAGFLSSQRSESTNNAICFKARRTTTLTKFYDIFRDTVKRWRSLEQKKGYDANSSAPEMEIHCGLLAHAAKVYTIEVFQFFKKDFYASIGSTWTTVTYTNK